MKNLLSQQQIVLNNKEIRTKDRIQFKTTYNKILLEQVKEFAKKHNLRVNDIIIELSTHFINI